MFTFAISFLMLALMAVIALAALPDGKIVRNIRLNRQSFGPGREADLLKIATPEQLQQWQEQGLISGDWGVNSDPADSTATAAGQSTPDELEPVAAQISSSLGFARNGNESPLQFLNRFSEEAAAVGEELNARERAASEAHKNAVQERDAAVAERDAARAEAEKLRAGAEEAEALKARVAELEAQAAKPKK